jgi:MtN3 and saliva related transmembrane protein
MIELIGFLAGILGVLAWFPQVRTVWFEKRHDGVSLPTLFLIVFTLSLWVTYGFLIDATPIIYSNIAAILTIVSVIIGVIKLRKP